MRVLQTRTTPEGFKRRRYESAGGLRWSTIEVPVEVWNGINRQGHARNRAEQWQRARERDSMRLQARKLHAAGRTPAEIHKTLNVPKRTIYRWLAP